MSDLRLILVDAVNSLRLMYIADRFHLVVTHHYITSFLALAFGGLPRHFFQLVARTYHQPLYVGETCSQCHLPRTASSIPCTRPAVRVHVDKAVQLPRNSTGPID